MITGDCEKQEESELLKRGCDVSADVLKVGHHGSDTSSTSQWLKEVGAQYAVISCGADNKYGHPDEETYSRICKYVKMCTLRLRTAVWHLSRTARAYRKAF